MNMLRVAGTTLPSCHLVPRAVPIFQANLPLPLQKSAPVSCLSRSIRNMSSWGLLVSPKELHDRFGEKGVVPLCASWFLPNDPSSRTGIATFKEAHIPGSRFFDIDAVKDEDSPYPHMLPSAEHFCRAMRDLGIANSDTVVIYDTQELGIFSAPRAAWTMRTLGHERVHILNNFRLWVEGGYPLTNGEPETRTQSTYSQNAVSPTTPPAAVVGFEFVKDLVTPCNEAAVPETKVLDARTKGRFDGVDPEPRPGLPSGHMPKSINVPFFDVLDPVTKTFLPVNDLKQLFESRGITSDDFIISSCGTGVTATVVDTALELAGYDHKQRAVYDGSWTEWAQRVKLEEGLIITNKSQKS